MRARLAQHAETIARALLGEPNQRLSNGSQLRFGAHGSIAVEIEGRKAGAWFDHEADTGGGLLDLIVRVRGGTKAHAVAWAKSIGLDLSTRNGESGSPRRRIAEYVYRDRTGEPLYRVVRWDPKTFTQERFDPAGGCYLSGKECMKGVERVPYRLPEWIGDQPGPIYVVEGEKDVDRLVQLGVRATTNPGGAGKWSPRFAPFFANHDVVIIPDHDQAGRGHANEVATNLRPIARSVRMIELPGLAAKEDISDWLDAGHTLDELSVLNAAPAQAQPIEHESEDGKKTKRSITTELVQIALAGTELFTTPGDQVAYAAFEIDGHREVWPLRSRGFKTWIARRLYEESKGTKTASAQAIADALVTIEGAAMFEGAVRQVYLRVAHHNGRYYLDLADDRWRAIEIGPGGWRVIAQPPAYFRRTRGTLPLPEPVPGGSLDPLRDLFNIGSEDDAKILIAWIVAALRPAGPYPVLDLAGEQGSAKSTTARALRSLIDPGEPMIRAAPKQERDLAIAVSNAHALVLDNLSDVQPWLSDALCRFATGGGWACRQLYTDDDQILIDAMKPIMINGIEELALRPDLKDRTLAVVLPTIEEDDRVEEGEFWHRFEQARPAILGALLDVVAAGLANLPKVKLRRLPRMADFARWIAACEPALGWEPGSFADLYTANRTTLGELAIEANETIRMIRDNAVCHGEHESIGSLLDKLRLLCGDDRANLKELPKTPRALGGLLRRYAPELRTAGLEVVFGKKTRTGWPVTIKERGRAQPSQPSHRHESREAAGFSRDGRGDGPNGRSATVAATVTEKTNEINACDGRDGRDGSARTQSRDNPLPLDNLDRMAGEEQAYLPACAHCHKPVEPSTGYTVSSAGDHLHNHCVDAWVRS
jgi:hypothetical protein